MATFFLAVSPKPYPSENHMLSGVTDAYRIVNGEGDFLPGLIVDRYNEFLVCQFFTAGMDCFKPLIVDSLSNLLRCERHL